VALVTEGVLDLNPVVVEESIQRLVLQIAQGVRAVSLAQQAFQRADRVFDVAYAKAYMAASGPQTEKRYAATVETEQQRMDRDVAELAFKHAERQMKALEGQLSAFQTMAKSVTSMFGAAGTGRGQ
jgi:vacuolar-type H+-ATPase catalytic subunit A/Vma1